MDLNFYSDLTDGTGQHDDDPEFLDPQSFNGFDSDNKVTAPEWIRHPHTNLFAYTLNLKAASKCIMLSKMGLLDHCSSTALIFLYRWHWPCVL